MSPFSRKKVYGGENVGKSKDEGERVYVGGEAVVTLKNIRRFIASLHAVLADLPRADSMRLS